MSAWWTVFVKALAVYTVALNSVEAALRSLPPCTTSEVSPFEILKYRYFGVSDLEFVVPHGVGNVNPI